MKATENWLYIEPFVYIAINPVNGLLYNTLNGKTIEVAYGTKSYALIRRLNRDENLMVVKLRSNYQDDANIQDFIKKVRKYYIGDVIDRTKKGLKPLQLKPFFNIQRDLNVIREDEKSIGTQVLQQITDISIQINATCSLNCSNCERYFKQFRSCTKKTLQTEMNFQLFKRIIEDLRGSDVRTINITGGNVWEYSHFDELIKMVSDNNMSVSFTSHYQNILSSRKVLTSLKKCDTIVEVLLFAPIDVLKLNEVVRVMESNGITSSYNFIVENEDDCLFAEELYEELHMVNYRLFPFYNGGNISFFKKNVFYGKSDILRAKPQIATIHSRKVMNQNYYGKLIIMSNGDVHANVNELKLGNIGDNVLRKFANEEMLNGRSWYKTRSSITPCRKCIYNLLCPSISNYEYAIGKYNLCRVCR